MLRYLAYRIALMVPTLIAISMLTFIIIQLPPGDFLSAMLAEMASQGEGLAQEKVAALRALYGLDQPILIQYFTWITNFVQGDLGWSFEYDRPVAEVIGDRFLLTAMLALVTVLTTWVIAFPIGIYSATHQYSWGDYTLTFLGFLGLATPNFLLALLLQYYANVWFGTSVGGLMDAELVDAPMSLEKLGSILEHLWIPVLIIGASGTAGMIRRLRANLLDELRRPYVTTARAKGLSPGRVLLKYPLRMSLNPFVSDIGNVLPDMISGAALVSIVLSLPTNGPILVRALQSQDMYLAGSMLLLEAGLVVLGVLVSDLLLAVLDPRIRFGGGQSR